MMPHVPAVLTGCLVLALAGVGIAAANVLGPVLIRLLFPHRLGLMTGVFTALVSSSAGMASGITVPLDTSLFHNWRTTLVALALPSVPAVAAMALVAWRHHRFERTVTSSARSATPRWQPGVLRSPVAWGLIGVLVGGIGMAVVWSILLGLGQGGQLSLALTLINLRAPNTATVTSPSTMVQSIGYTIAALGPLAAGVIHGATDSWTMPLLVLLAVTMPMAACGWLAGRDNPVAVHISGH